LSPVERFTGLAGFQAIASRTAALALVQVSLLTFFSAVAYIASLFQALGVFYATELAYFPLFARSDLLTLLTMFLPIFVGGIIGVIFLLVVFSMLPSARSAADGKKFKNIRIITQIITSLIFGYTAYVLFDNEMMGLFSITLLLLFSLAFNSLGLGSDSISRTDFNRKVVGIASMVLLLLVFMFSTGYVGALGAVDKYEESKAFAIVDGKWRKVAIIFPGSRNTLYYDGKTFRVSGQGFLQNLRTRPRQRR
jgi:hypothetical protein